MKFEKRNQQTKNEIKNDQPLVSVIMPVYNGEKFVGEAIESVINQTYKNWELIIVDDGSIDNSKKVIAQYISDECIKYIRHKENKGIPAARNAGIPASKGKYIAFLDQDDIWYSSKLKKSVESMTALNNPGLVQTGLVITRNNQAVIRRKEGYSLLPKEKLAAHLFLRKKPFSTASTVMVNRRCFSELGLMDERLTRWDDQEMWIRILLADEEFSVGCIEEPLVEKRSHASQASMGFETLQDWMRLHDIVLKKNPSLRKYGRKHLSAIHYALGTTYFWKNESSDGYLRSVCGNYVKSIFFNYKNWKAYIALTLSILGSYGRNIWVMFRKLKRKEGIPK